MELKFWKYEGAGNDFILLDGRAGDCDLRPKTIRALCGRHHGVGADGLMVLLDVEGFDFCMRYFNADGGEADMCGNGGRCIALFADHLGIGGDAKTFIGRDGIHSVRIVSRDGDKATVELGMIDVKGFERRGEGLLLNTGVPHYVEFVNDVNSLDVNTLGRPLRDEHNANVNFVELMADGLMKIRTYERGVEGETLACGTGAVAAVIATHISELRHMTDFMVHVRGGTLEVRFSTPDHQFFRDILLTGPARRVFEGKIKL